MGVSPGSITNRMPPADDDFARRQRDIARTQREQAAARALEATSIGEGGLRVIGGSVKIEAGGTLEVDGNATFNGSLTVPAGSLNTAGNITAGGAVEAANVIATGGATVGGTLDAEAIDATSLLTSGNLTANGQIRMPNVPVTILSSAYFATYASTSDGGRVGHVPSSRRFKQDEAPATLDPATILALQLVTFRYIAAVEELGEDADRELGLIAEEVDALGLDWLVYYDPDGAPLGVRYERLALALLPLVQTLSADVAAIKEHVGL